MPFCSNCGQSLEDNAKFCGHCGAPNQSATEPNEPILSSSSHDGTDDAKRDEGSAPNLQTEQDLRTPNLRTPHPVSPQNEPKNELIFNVAVGKVDKGKHTLQGIKDMITSGQLDHDCRVWQKGMSDWKSAKEVPEIAILLEAMPPPLEDEPPPIPANTMPQAEPVAKRSEPSRFSPMMDIFPPGVIKSLREHKCSPNFGSGIIQTISELAEMELEDAAKIVDGFWAYVADTSNYSLANRQYLTIPHFGTFFIRKKGARVGMNPQTRERIKIKASWAISFKLSPSHQGGHRLQHEDPMAIKVKDSSANWTHRWKGRGLKHLSRKRRLAVYVHELTGVPLSHVSIGLDMLYRLVLAQVFRCPVVFRGRGTFYPRKYSARTGLNPLTQERIKIKACTRVVFRAASQLKRNLVI